MNGEDGELSSVRRNGKSEAAFRTISEVADDLDVPQHVLRFWEGKFPQVKPLKRGGGRRYYRPDDVALLRRIRDLLYSEGYTIKGVQKLLKEGGGRDAAVPSRGQAEHEPELILEIRDPDPPEPADIMDAPEIVECGEAPMEEIGTVPANFPSTNDEARLKPGLRRELEALLAELEHLRGLLQPR
ncbi:MAG: MerR family transcriptional regulator [Phaeospirillum sp.]|nr:MerR family transcriptional regulator [Phaeospirillum sp.]